MRGRSVALWGVGLVWVAFAVLAGACGGGGDAAEDDVTGEVFVFAASSLTEAFKEAGKAFEAKHPGATVTFNFAASSILATQINERAPADVFASADMAQMQVVAGAGNLSGEPVSFATNYPLVVVPKGSSKVVALADLAKPGVKLVLAGPEVPIGKYAREIFAKASANPGAISADFSDKALANLQSNEANVRGVLAKVQLGEADAGVVYSTDAAIAAREVSVVTIDAAYNVVATYPIAQPRHGKNAAGGKAFVAFILSPEGQAILAKYGFGKP
ncbi:MAG: molybdate ABC transporter substrate-binding protein [Dehalococcoidia bacterium]|nr:molybdate ABC transporter substrate-binding protein [Dehalococcoidia bacterium]